MNVCICTHMYADGKDNEHKNAYEYNVVHVRNYEH